jgi:hypothetical protein
VRLARNETYYRIIDLHNLVRTCKLTDRISTGRNHEHRLPGTTTNLTRFRRAGLFAAAAVPRLGHSAHATYTFDATDPDLVGPYGTVTLTDNGTGVDFTIQLRSDLDFVNTGGTVFTSPWCDHGRQHCSTARGRRRSCRREKIRRSGGIFAAIDCTDAAPLCKRRAGQVSIR